MIAAIVLLQLVWLVAPRSGSRPLSPRALEAARESVEHPSQNATTSLEQQLSRDVDHRDKRNAGLFVLLLVLDGIGIYYFWNSGVRRPIAP